MKKTQYPGFPWRADEDEDCVRLFYGERQVLKAPKRNTPYLAAWPEPEQLRWMLRALNAASLLQGGRFQA